MNAINACIAAFHFQVKLKILPMHKWLHDYAATNYIPSEWLDSLEKDHLASVALRGPGKNLIHNILLYSKQLVVLGSITKILVNLN